MYCAISFRPFRETAQRLNTRIGSSGLAARAPGRLQDCARTFSQTGAAVEPLQAVVIVLGGHRPQHRISQCSMAAGRVVDVIADETGLYLDARSAVHAPAAIVLECDLEIALGKIDRVAQANAVLHCHAGALRHVLQRRVRSIAQ